MKCGQEKEVATITEYDVCPAVTKTSANGINGGKNGGRICWAIAGTLSNERIKGTFAKERFTCLCCDFFKSVNREENATTYEILTPIQLNEFCLNRKSFKSLKRKQRDRLKARSS